MTVETDPEVRNGAERHLDVKVVKLGGIDQFQAGGAESVVERLFRAWLEECRLEAIEAKVEVEKMRTAPAVSEVGPGRKPALAFVRPESGGGDV